MLKYLAIIIFLVLSFVSSGQEYSYKHYSIPEGLPQSQITCLFQDSKGFIWVGTKGGVAKFDGYEFENFTVNEGLTANFISHISEDNQGNICILTPLGINFCNGEEIISFQVDDSIKLGETGLDLAHDRNGNIWIANENKKCSFIRFRDGIYTDATLIYKVLAGLNIQQLLFDKKNNQLLITTHRSDVYLIQGDKIRKFSDKNFQNPFLVQNKQGETYLFGNQNIYSIKKSKLYEILKSENIFSKRILDFDKNGIIYFKKNTNILSENNGKETLDFQKEFNRITVILVDNENNLWIGTDSGLYRLLSRAFKNFTPEMGTPEYTWSILEDRKGNIWFASYGYGLGCYDGTRIVQNTDYLKVTGVSTSFYTGSIVDSNGDLQFSSSAGVIKYDGTNFSKIDEIHRTVLDIFEDTLNNKILYSVTRDSDLITKNADNTFDKIVKKPGNKTGYIKSIGMDKFGRYWIGNEYGLSIIDGNNIVDYPNEENQYSAGAISIYRDHKGNMWLGTTRGLYFYNYEKFRRVGKEFFNSSVVSFMDIDSNNLVIGCSNGIGIFDIGAFYSSGEERTKWYDKTNGFMGIECIRNGMFKDSKGNIWIAASNQVVKLDPSKLNELNTLEPQTYIKNISTLDNEMRWKKLLIISHTQTDTIFEFPYYTKDIRFIFHAISHTAPEWVRYRYQLAGYDKGWSEVTSERYATYTNLLPGDYEFRVKACNNDGIWNREPTVIKFSIIPAFWQTTGFFIGANLLFLLIVISLILLYIRRKRKKEKQKEEIEKQLTELQLKTIKNQVEPHFIFNVINSLGSVIFKEKKDVAYDYLTKFSRLIRTTLETSDQIGRSLEEEINFVKDYLDLQKFRFKNKFDYKINVHNEINQNMEIPKMIIQTHVENAIKHGLLHQDKDGKISIEVSKDTSAIRLMILDNGVGRKRAEELNKDSTQKGLKILDQFYSHINKFNRLKITQEIIDLYNKDGKPSGTKVIVRIPIDFNMKI